MALLAVFSGVHIQVGRPVEKLLIWVNATIAKSMVTFRAVNFSEQLYPASVIASDGTSYAAFSSLKPQSPLKKYCKVKT